MLVQNREACDCLIYDRHNRIPAFDICIDGFPAGIDLIPLIDSSISHPSDAGLKQIEHGLEVGSPCTADLDFHDDVSAGRNA